MEHARNTVRTARAVEPIQESEAQRMMESANLIKYNNSMMQRKAMRTLGGRLMAGVMAMALLLGLALAPGLQAQIPAAPQDEPVALTGGTIHTVTDGVIENGTIVFEDGVITDIGTGVNVPAGAREVDVSGRHIYPGLVDPYNQMGLYEIGAVGVTVDINESDDINPNVRPQVAFNPESRHIGVTRSNGVLVSVSSPGGGLISGQSSAMMLDGWTWEDMVLKEGTGLLISWPSFGGGWGQSDDDYEDELRQLRNVFDEARAYKRAQQAAEASQAGRHDKDSRWESMIPVLEGERPVVVGANDLRQIQDAITFAQEEEVELIILGGDDAPKVADRLVRHDIPVIVTSVLSSPGRSWEPYDGDYSLPAQLQEAGVEFAIGGTSSAPYGNRHPYEAGAAAAFGLTADEALRAVTLKPAEILGFDDRVGSLETGKDATLLITTGNPLEYSTRIDQAYIEGREIDMMDAHREFYEKYREKVRQREQANR